jgi:hypothetical protein
MCRSDYVLDLFLFFSLLKLRMNGLGISLGATSIFGAGR